MLMSALHQESNNMVVPAMQLASKIPDMSVQLWSSALLRGKGGKRLVLKMSGKEPLLLTGSLCGDARRAD